MRAGSVGIVCGALLLLSACQPPQPSFGNEQASAAITDQLRARVVSYGAGSSPCSDFFSVGEAVIVDRKIDSEKAEIVATYAVTAKERIGEASTLSHCYGAPSGGWYAGMTANSRESYLFERWESGWRLVRRTG